MLSEEDFDKLIITMKGGRRSLLEDSERQGKDDLLIWKYYLKFPNLKGAIANCYWTNHFKLDTTILSASVSLAGYKTGFSWLSYRRS